MKYIISETKDGRFIVQTPNSFGGLYPLVVAYEDNCRNTGWCFGCINTHWLDSNFPEPVTIEMRLYNHPDNHFNENYGG